MHSWSIEIEKNLKGRTMEGGPVQSYGGLRESIFWLLPVHPAAIPGNIICTVLGWGFC